ncbi:protein phosphatase 1 regulatory subunit 15A [Xenopus laevis]|uniref:Protein phosphatase 1 regulatory subunit 15A n=2 Tax=Xenopus laevis TaxID=8355 RepID=A0A1L8FH50_XENLA|nr:protein phosphatase 1 regulatory subunit 15A [Xenopus laevis]XP_018083711.1 protein phosphatase 1 regulatory subunit 15A [Xenopus laevis]OCT70911.1 hypothetical protein XELAEV_18037836mg [Xenopus laevis]
MDLHYLTIGLSMSNLTTPFFDWHKGTALELDMFRAKPKMQAIDTEMGTDMVIFTMAARTTQTLVSLAKTVKPQLHWKWTSVNWIGRAVRAVMSICRNVLGSLVGMGSSVSMRFYWKDLMESPAQNPTAREEKMLSPTSVMMPIQDMELMTMDWSFDGHGSMERMPNKEAIESSCTNPRLLSMVYLPSDDDDDDASSTSEASDLNELEEDDKLWMDEKESCCTENNKVVDSSQTPGSTVNTEESDWSDEDSWDSDAEAESSKLDKDLWASFCQNDDPYNPLCFAMPTKSPKKTHEPKKDIAGYSVNYPVLLGESGEEDFKNHTPSHRETLCNKLSSHSQVPLDQLNEELVEPFNKTQKQKRSHIKRVRFSPTVKVHHMVAWSYAYRTARKGPWEEYARDRCRFQRRIAETEAAIGFCLDPQHREKIRALLHKSNNM